MKHATNGLQRITAHNSEWIQDSPCVLQLFCGWAWELLLAWLHFTKCCAERSQHGHYAVEHKHVQLRCSRLRYSKWSINEKQFHSTTASRQRMLHGAKTDGKLVCRIV